MRILLCSLNSKYIHSSLSVWYLAENVRECSQDITVNILECTVNQSEDMVIQAICEKCPDVLAFSCYIWNISFIQRLIGQIAVLLPKTVIILGGPEVSYNAKEVLLNNPDVDFIIMGEGEIPFAQLISQLQTGEGISDIPGLCYRTDNRIIQCNSPGESLTQPPSPYSNEYFKTLGGRIAYLETSRGCPFSCAFCLSGQMGCPVRFFDLDCAKKELLLLAQSGARTIKLVDRTFNCNPDRAYDLFSFIIQNAGNLIPPGICFHFEVAADLFDDKTLNLLAEAPPGLVQLEAGLQSFNLQTLEAVGRKTDLTALEQNIRALLKNQNIHLHIDLIAGLPYEDLDSFTDSFNRAYALAPHMLQLGFLKMLQGADLRARARELGYAYSTLPPYQVESNPWLSEEDMQTLAHAEFALQKLYNSGRFLLTLNYLLNVTGIRPFALFCGLGEYMRNFIRTPLALDVFSTLAFEYFTALPGVTPGALRDVLVCDSIACGKKIPSFLKVADRDYKCTLSLIRKTYFNGRNNFKLNAALLYSDGKRAVFVDGPRSPLTERQDLRFISIEDLGL